MTDYSHKDIMAVLQAANNSGASGAFIAVLATPYDGQHLARNKAVRALFGRDDRTVRQACTGGHFMTALWEGDTQRAWRRADGRNRSIMRAAGVAPTEVDA